MVFTAEGRLYHARRSNSDWVQEIVRVDGLINPPATRALPNLGMCEGMAVGSIITETANAALGGSGASLALDSHDRIHLVYLDYSTTCRLRYVFQTAQGWRTEIIDQDPLGCAGVLPILRLDAEGNPQVAYPIEFERTSNLKFAFKDFLGWHLQTVESDAGEFSSLAIGPGNKAWIAYLDWAQHDVKLARAQLDTYLRLPQVWNEISPRPCAAPCGDDRRAGSQ